MMKYLKKYNESKSVSKENYYYNINTAEYHDLLYTDGDYINNGPNAKPFTKEELDKLKYIDKNSDYKFEFYTGSVDYAYRSNNTAPRTSIIIISFRLSNIDGEFYIYKIDDEWFLIGGPKVVPVPLAASSWTYYKCDQFEGLLKFLADAASMVYDIKVNEDNKYSGYELLNRYDNDPMGEKNMISVSDQVIFEIESHGFEVNSFNLDGNIFVTIIFNEILLTIYAYEDEWFRVDFIDIKASHPCRITYSCDQLEGLINLLKDTQKKHESFGRIVYYTESNNNENLPLYKNLSREEWAESGLYKKSSKENVEKGDKFTKYEWEKIKTHLTYFGHNSKRCIDVFTIMINQLSTIHNGGSCLSYNLMVRYNHYGRITIFKCKDEWFYVLLDVPYIEDCYYKCDSIDGVIDLFDDKL